MYRGLCTAVFGCTLSDVCCLCCGASFSLATCRMPSSVSLLPCFVAWCAGSSGCVTTRCSPCRAVFLLFRLVSNCDVTCTAGPAG